MNWIPLRLSTPPENENWVMVIEPDSIVVVLSVLDTKRIYSFPATQWIGNYYKHCSSQTLTHLFGVVDAMNEPGIIEAEAVCACARANRQIQWIKNFISSTMPHWRRIPCRIYGLFYLPLNWCNKNF